MQGAHLPHKNQRFSICAICSKIIRLPETIILQGFTLLLQTATWSMARVGSNGNCISRREFHTHTTRMYATSLWSARCRQIMLQEGSNSRALDVHVHRSMMQAYMHPSTLALAEFRVLLMDVNYTLPDAPCSLRLPDSTSVVPTRIGPSAENTAPAMR